MGATFLALAVGFSLTAFWMLSPTEQETSYAVSAIFVAMSIYCFKA